MPLTDEDIYVGETVLVTVSAFDRYTKNPISDAVCTVDFFAPPKNPKHNPADRTADHTVTATYDAGSHTYMVEVDTTGWTPGKWYYRSKLVNVSTSWTYSVLLLLA